MSDNREWKNQDKEYHEDPGIVGSFDQRITRKYRLERKYYTLDKWIDQLEANNAKVVMDYGCATGSASLALLRRNIKAISVDASIPMLKQLRLKAEKEGLKSNEVACDVERMPFKDSSFDGIICLGVLHHLPDIILAVKEQIRVIKPGGLLFISEPFNHKPWVSYPYYFIYHTAKFIVGLFKIKRLTTRERELSFWDINAITALSKTGGLECEVSYFVYWANIFGFLPECLAYPLVRLVNAVNFGLKRGDIVFIKIKKCGR